MVDSGIWPMLWWVFLLCEVTPIQAGGTGGSVLLVGQVRPQCRYYIASSCTFASAVASSVLAVLNSFAVSGSCIGFDHQSEPLAALGTRERDEMRYYITMHKLVTLFADRQTLSRTLRYQFGYKYRYLPASFGTIFT